MTEVMIDYKTLSDGGGRSSHIHFWKLSLSQPNHMQWNWCTIDSFNANGLKFTQNEQCDAPVECVNNLANPISIPVGATEKSLPWRHNDHDGVSNPQPHGCLLNRLFGCRSKKTSKLRVTGLCAGNSPGPVNSPHKGPVTRKMFPFDDVIMVTSAGHSMGFNLAL